jgi:hypothetical protein
MPGSKQLRQVSAIIKGTGGGVDPASGDYGADHVPLEEAVQGTGDQSGAAVQTAARRNRAVEAPGNSSKLLLHRFQRAAPYFGCYIW